MSGSSSWVSRMWKEYTGEATFEKADTLYKSVKERFEKHTKYYEKTVNKISNDIENKVNSINESKCKIRKELFPQFAEQMKFFQDITVSEELIKACIEGTSLDSTTIRGRESLFLIDFDKEPFKSNALAVVSFGFATRKKATETYYKVQEEESRLNEEIARMDSEIAKLRAISNSLSNIMEYFSSLIPLYESILLRLENSSHYLLTRCLTLAHRLTDNKLSIKLLPQSQQNEIEAAKTITYVLKEMVDSKITVEINSTSITSGNEALLYKSNTINRIYIQS